MNRDRVLLIVLAMVLGYVLCRTGISMYKPKDACQAFKDKLAGEVGRLSRKHAEDKPALRKRFKSTMAALKANGRCDEDGRRRAGANLRSDGSEPTECKMLNTYLKTDRLLNAYKPELKRAFC